MKERKIRQFNFKMYKKHGLEITALKAKSRIATSYLFNHYALSIQHMI